MKLYGFWRSSCSWRVRIALAYKGIDYEYVSVDLISKSAAPAREAYASVNPLSQVPLLEWSEDGELRRVSQSLAIIELLEEQHPEPALLPQGRFVRARARQLAEVINAGIQPAQNLRLLKELKRVERSIDTFAWSRRFIERGFAALQVMAEETAGDFLVGDSPTVADVCLVPQLYNARRFELDLAPYPLLLRAEESCARLEAFQVAHADRQPDAGLGDPPR